MAESRTAKSLKNAQVSFFYYVVFMILGFWSRKVFFDYLGSEVVGLETWFVKSSRVRNWNVGNLFPL